MQTERPLGLLEKFQTSKYFVNCYGAATFTTLLRHPPRPRVSASDQQHDTIKQFYLEHLYSPMIQLVQTHPQLSLVVADWTQPTIHFARLSEFDLSTIVHVDTSNKPFWDRVILSDIIAQECDHEFDFDDHTIPLWHLRIYVHQDRLDECSLTLTSNHVVLDGSSTATFWRELLTELNKKDDEKQNTSTIHENYIIKSNPEKLLLGAYEDRHGPMPTSWELLDLLMRKKLKDVLPSGWKQYWFPSGWAGDRRGVTDKAVAHHHTMTRAIELGGTVWKNVCATSKMHHVTPHAAIMAAMMTAFARLYQDQDHVVTHTPINCRSFCKGPPVVPQDEMGNFVGNYTHHWVSPYLNNNNLHHESDASFWDKAKHYYDHLKMNKTQGAKDPGKWKLAPRFPEDYIKTWYDNWDANPMARSGGIQLSDLGLFHVPNNHQQHKKEEKKDMVDNGFKNSWEVQSVWFSQSSQMMSMALSVTSVSTKSSMYSTVTWQKGALDESKIEQFGPLVIDILQKLCQ
ncbi:alcohol acetyltransferase-domain-containing protein [Phascolomyces articulosus]|uniref:Alcohol acetyltransferase-domain-containing protein n=1 Tax=Phascolomyces articulosus TaxID=60185 RepID=A0AAD5PFQ9_9FUNG|nr:alcohol acetyltransferase-domain-containing protein [Phascolomyces articulosus]